MENPAPERRRSGSKSQRSKPPLQFEANIQNVKKGFWRNKAGNCSAWSPPAPERHNNRPAADFSVHNHQNAVSSDAWWDSSNFPLILPLPFKQPIKSPLGNMTHVLRPFQPLLSRQAAVICSCSAWLLNHLTLPTLPVHNGMGSNLKTTKLQTAAGRVVERQKDVWQWLLLSCWQTFKLLSPADLG